MNRLAFLLTSLFCFSSLVFAGADKDTRILDLKTSPIAGNIFGTSGFGTASKVKMLERLPVQTIESRYSHKNRQTEATAIYASGSLCQITNSKRKKSDTEIEIDFNTLPKKEFGVFSISEIVDDQTGALSHILIHLSSMPHSIVLECGWLTDPRRLDRDEMNSILQDLTVGDVLQDLEGIIEFK